MKRFLLAGTMALLGLLLILVGCGSNGTANTSNTSVETGATPITTGEQQQSKPTQPAVTVAAGVPTVGKAYVVSDTWTITVNSVKTTKVDLANPYIKPDAGKQFIVINVTMKNTSLQTQHVSDVLMFSLRDSTGQTASIAYMQSAEQAPNGPVSAGQKLTGDLVYQVPLSEHSLSLGFQPDFGADLTEWKLTV